VHADQKHIEGAEQSMSNTTSAAGKGLRNNRVFALCYRGAAFIACLIGVLDTVGVFRGDVKGEMLLFYTTESNVLVVIMLGVLLTKTVLGLKNKGVYGSSSYCERLSAIVALAITVTMLIFWGLLARTMTDMSYLLSYSNLQIHLVTPLLMIIDFFIFAAPGKLKKQDPLFFAIVPLAYFAQATILGFSGFTYEVLARDGAVHYFPYFFIDFYETGIGVFAYVGVLTVFFIGLAYLLLWLDRVRGRRSARNG
jgi:hypothetical protein